MRSIDGRQPGLAPIAVLTVVATFFSSPIRAGINEFPAIGPEGGQVVDVGFHRSNSSIIYLISSAGFHRSDDGGQTWQLKPHLFAQSPKDLAIDPSNADRVYVAGGSSNPFESSSVCESTNRGDTFTCPVRGPSSLDDSRTVEINNDGTAVYEAHYNQIYRNGLPIGGSLLTAEYVTILRAHPTNPNIIFAGDSLGLLFKSNDRAASWQIISTEPRAYLHDFELDASNPQRIWLANTNGLYVSHNGGANSSKNFGNGVVGVSVNPSNSSIVYAAEENGTLSRTTDDGGSWSEVLPNVGRYSFVAKGDVSFDRSNPSRLIAFGGLGVWLSEDGGQSWQSRNSGINASRVIDIERAGATDRLYASIAGRGIVRLRGTGPEIDNDALSQLGSERDPTVEYVRVLEGAEDTLIGVLSAGTVVRSTDSGQTWSRVATPPGVLFFDLELKSTPSGPVAYAATSEGLFLSRDLGSSWQARNNAWWPGEAQLIAASADASTVYVVISEHQWDHRVFGSVDGGDTWAATSLSTGRAPISALEVDPLDGRIWAALPAALHVSSDGGLTWRELAASSVGDIVFDAANPQVMYATNGVSFMRLMDDGQTIHRLTSSEGNLAYSMEALAFDTETPNTMFVGTQGAGIKRLDLDQLGPEPDDPPAPAPTPPPPQPAPQGGGGGGAFLLSPWWLLLLSLRAWRAAHIRIA